MFALVSLLDSLDVKGLTLKNRIVMPPMHKALATTEGVVTDELIEHYTRRSKSLGLLIVEHSYFSLEGRHSDRQLGINSDYLISGLEKLSSNVQATGTPVVIQINHAGEKASNEAVRTTPVAPSPSARARKLRFDEIETLTDAFAVAADRTIRSGFDGVELHGAHGFLLNQFYSPLTNQRQDKYGGSLDNRMRFPLEVVERVKERVGGRLVIYRLGSDDLNPEGIKIQDSMKFACKLEEAGVDIIDVSGGLCGDGTTRFQDRQGYFVPQARRIKEVVNIPVIGVGGITDPKYANKLIEEGQIDLVAVGRALLRDPDWATKAVKTLATFRDSKSRGNH